MMISKLIDIGRLLQTALHEGTIDHYDGRRSGDSTGLALATIGNLMRLDTPYEVSLKGTSCNHRMDMQVYKMIQDRIQDLKLEHFTFHENLTVRYNIWHKGL